MFFGGKNNIGKVMEMLKKIKNCVVEKNHISLTELEKTD